MKKTKTIIVRVPFDEHKKIKEEAAKRSTTISKLVRQSLVYFTNKFTV